MKMIYTAGEYWMSMHTKEIYRIHNVGSAYIELASLENLGKVFMEIRHDLFLMDYKPYYIQEKQLYRDGTNGGVLEVIGFDPFLGNKKYGFTVICSSDNVIVHVNAKAFLKMELIDGN